VSVIFYKTKTGYWRWYIKDVHDREYARSRAEGFVSKVAAQSDFTHFEACFGIHIQRVTIGG